MITKIVDSALGNRAVVLILVLLLVGVGFMSMQRLPFDADPDISPLQVLVTTQAPGLAPVDVERNITAPIELPPSMSMGIPASSSALMTPTWAKPRAPPPDSTSPMPRPEMMRAMRRMSPGVCGRM